MYQNFELFCFGAAMVIDTVLLVTLLDRRNGRRVMAPVLTLILGAWLFHTASFVHALLADLSSHWSGTIHLGLMASMALGLVLMPSATLHILWRLLTTGFSARPRFEARYLLPYLPVLVLPLLVFHFGTGPHRRFLELTRPVVLPYLVWASLINIAVCVVCFRSTRAQAAPGERRFFRLLGVTFIAMTGITIGAVAWGYADPERLPVLQTLAVLAPLLPAVAFAYFVVRFNFLQLFIERTLLYGALAVGGMLLYQVALHDVHASLETQYGVNSEILLGVLVAAVILLYSPLRRTILEGLLYLMTGRRVVTLRDRFRRLSLRIVAEANHSPADLLAMFLNEVGDTLDLHFISGGLVDPSGRITTSAGGHATLSAEQFGNLHSELAGQLNRFVTLRDAPTPRALEIMHTAGASAAIAFEVQSVGGLVLLGRRARNRDFGEEEANALVLLVEQLGFAIHNSALQAEALASQRRALQNEKLTTLGLLAGAVAHEVKNPLSSIKTIASVIAERVGPDSEYAEDLRLILCEVNRLALTTGDLLAFARPQAGGPATGSVAATLHHTLSVMGHLARQRGIVLTVDVAEPLPDVNASNAALQEIFFNLLINSLDAAGGGGRVDVTCQRENGHVVTHIHDSGPGIPAKIQDRMFEPFVTTKEGGTGLGLYLVGRRVHEIGGEIECRSEPSVGTRFIVRLPLGA